MATLRDFNPVGSFQKAKRQRTETNLLGQIEGRLGAESRARNALSDISATKGRQDIAAEEAAIPRRNALADLQQQTAQLGLTTAEQKQTQQTTQFDQQQALQRSKVLGQSAQALLGLDPSQRAQALQAIAPQLLKFGVDVSQFPAERLTDANLQIAIAESQAFVGSGGDVSSLDQAREEKVRAETAQIGVTKDTATTDNLRDREITLKEQEAQRRNLKLSAGLEGALLKSQDLVVQSQRDSNEFEILANQFRDRTGELEGGVKSTFSEFIKAALGTQDDVIEFRRKFNKVRLSEGLKNLPPGPATDRDVQEAFRGVPKENAGPEQIESFLRGAARLARLDAAFNQFKADFISGNSTAKGMNKSWRQTFESPVLGRSVSNVEIYETAQNRSVTPEDVRKQLGL